LIEATFLPSVSLTFLATEASVSPAATSTFLAVPPSSAMVNDEAWVKVVPGPAPVILAAVPAAVEAWKVKFSERTSTVVVPLEFASAL
jgi:hypothetical protein